MFLSLEINIHFILNFIKANKWDKLINSLINDIKKVIESNRENYYKLKEFVDSL